MSTTNLTMASRQWATRPADERYWDVAELKAAVAAERAESVEKPDVPLSACRVIAHPAAPGDLLMTGPQGGAVGFTHYAFGQLAGAIGAPAGYIRTLPAELAAENMNHGLRSMGSWHANCLIRRTPQTPTLRALTSGQYGRIWNEEVVRVAESLESRGWRVPPARPSGIPGERTRTATAADVLRAASHPGLGIRTGDLIAPAGLYASDRDAFVFLIDESHPVTLAGFTGYRGVFLWNSEVGAKTCGLTMFLFDSVCGNHIVWSAKVFADVRVRHTKNAAARWTSALYHLRRAVESSPAVEARMIEAARSTMIADSRDKVIELAYRKGSGSFTLAEAKESYTFAERYRDQHGDPNSVWGFTSGMTRYSQTVPHAADRERIDRAAGAMVEAVA